MKPRVVVWTIVGILAVIGVIFLISTSGRRPTAHKNLATLKIQLDRTQKQLDQLTEKVAQAKAAMPPGADMKQFARIDSLVAEVGQNLKQIEKIGKVNEAFDRLAEVRKLIGSARRIFDQTKRRPYRRSI
ncbi:hypothetical protein CH330_00680 [candidate division WOR-3 bacterium JGI_Cruoil_03_51_56]|uniref:Uncharacterized protein n=1 Tax=candidate division WOR-3 bacterium JGI_Cruoil_03_51_56 TaxID=1973747 RepID=A0A235BXZ0_UNCW3|nr:MAG: hypothetical protein CH330_00680 [candidate division WOR-3 bacterium JGI_Cruoil_03_51_56]